MLKAFVFKPIGAFRSLPTANTIFGAICWGIRWIESEDKLLETLQLFKTEPPFILSSPLPLKAGQLLFPRPIHHINLRPKSVEEYKRYKRFKALKWVNWEVFKKTLEQEPREIFEGEREAVSMDIVPHASIHRITATANLYNEPAYWLSNFVVLVRFFDKEYYPLLRACLEFSQLGGNKSVGMGRFRVEELPLPKDIEEYLTPTNSRIFLLSDSFYDKDFVLEDSFYDVRVQRSAVERMYGAITKRVWKDAVCSITPGSQLKVRKQGYWYGSIKPVLREGNTLIYQYGIGFPIFARW